jgi:hypothetical protein
MNMSILEKLLIEKPNKPWSYLYLIHNESISIKFIMKTKSLFNWDFDRLFLRQNISIDDINLIKQSELKLSAKSIKHLYENRYLDNKTVDLIFNNIHDKIPQISLSELMSKPSMNINYNLDKEHNKITTKTALMLRSNTLDKLKLLVPTIGNMIPKNMRYNIHINIDNINQFELHIRTIASIISYNYSTTIDYAKNFISNHKNTIGDVESESFWSDLTINLAISIDDIMENGTLPWDYYRITERIDITYESIGLMKDKFFLTHDGKDTYYDFAKKNNQRKIQNPMSTYEEINKILSFKIKENRIYKYLSMNKFDKDKLYIIYKTIHEYKENWKLLVTSLLNIIIPQVLTNEIFSYIGPLNFSFPELQKEKMKYDGYKKSIVTEIRYDENYDEDDEDDED